MHVLGTSNEYICIPLRGPETDLTGYAVYIAVVAEDAGEPATGDYQTASWINGEVCWKPSTDWATDVGTGSFMAYARIVAAPEDVRVISGRVRVGDVR